MSPEEQKEFSKQAKTVVGTQALNQLSSRAFSRAHARKTESGTHGEYQPLTYWATLGYNVDDIAARAQSADHDVLGKVYKVDIWKDKDVEANEELQTDHLTARGSKDGIKKIEAMVDGKVTRAATAVLTKLTGPCQSLGRVIRKCSQMPEEFAAAQKSFHTTTLATLKDAQAALRQGTAVISANDLKTMVRETGAHAEFLESALKMAKSSSSSTSKTKQD
jgi:hypothetical protein